MRLVGNGAMELVWQGLCSMAGGYVRRAYNSAQWDEVPCAFVPAAMRRPRACSSRHSGLVTALCAAVGIAFLLAPPPAFAQSTTLVSNLDRLSTLAPAAGIYAQGFRTGAHTAGYTIRNVQVRLAAGSVTSSTKTSVLIRQEKENGEPGALVTALTTQMPLVDGVNTFAAPANTTLNPQTNYFISVNEATPTRTCYERPLTLTSGQRIFCEYEGTPVDQQAVYVRAVYEFTGRREQSGADGWSIDDKRLYKNYLSQDWDTSDRIFLFISVNGDVHTPNIEPQVEIVPPTVDGTPSVSGAGTDAQWSVGETVGVTVTFSEAVDVDTSGGTPSIGIGLGGTAARSATYASGTGTTELVFEYTLVSGDGSHGYMAVTPDSLALNGGTIRSAGSGVDALLAHNGALTSGITERSTGPEASFQDVPKSHDGATAFTVGVQFSGQPAGLLATRDAASVLEVTGGSVTGARVTSESGNPAWEVTVAPDGLGEVTIEVPVRACTEANAVCIGGRSLSRAVETTVPGTPMTARFTQTPSAHDGSNGFELHMEFSHEPENFSYRTVQGALFDIEGGRIERVWRRERGKGRQWGIVVAPDGGGAVTLAARATTDCAAQNAVCDAEGWKFAGDLSLTVPGPASSSLPVVSIAASATPVTEGAAAAFTLSRTGATDAALTVSVSVSESEASVSGTPPTPVTFVAAAASVTLSVATEDDEVAEDASTVTATVSSGSGYTVSGTSGSADVVVEDDDAAPVVTTASPIVVAENATAVATLSATDADTAAEDLSWSIPAGAAGGVDRAKFALTEGGVLTFKAAKDYESPDDTDTDGDYEITVRVTDGVNPVDAARVVRLSAVDDTGPTASFEALPERHDGAAAFRFELHFSETPSGLSYRTVGGGLLEVTGGTLTHARRLTRGRNQGWEVTVVPTQAGDIVITLPARSCGEADAICIDGEPLARAATATVPGPASSSLPVVSIAASATPVTEGTAAAFTLSRTGATDAAVTVTVSVSESEASVSGTPPTSVTFAAGSASATLSVPTVDDEAAEDASTVTATVSSGSGYTVDGTSGSAELVVNDDDAAPVVATASPVVVAENATAVATLTATDADTAAADLSWSIPAGAAGGADGAKFALTADGALSFKAAKDFDAPDDADADGDYEITVRVTDGANPVDAALVVRLSDVDDAAPTLSSASVDGAVLTLTFSEALDTASQPPASSFAVSVGGTARTVDAVVVSGKVVTLTLSSAVTSGQTVTVGYTVPTGAGAKPVQDAAGNRAASFANTEAKNLTAAALPAVSIVAVSTPVTEGTAAAFVLRRTGATDDALTVTVSVSEAGSVLNGAPPSSATFAAGSAETRLTVATANDTVHEADARVRASIVAGEGYAVDADKDSAGVDVFDDDAPPQAAVELWSTTMTWTDLGNNWFGGFADRFSNPGWSEDGQAFRIWYISYDAGARTLLMAHDGSGGLIGAPGELSLHVGGHEVGAGEALSAFAGARVGRVSGVDAQWSVGEEVTVRLTRASGDAEAAPGGPGFSVADAQANEASGAPLRFRVTVDAPAQSTVSETVKGLELRTGYVFELRAVNLEGSGPAVRGKVTTPAGALGIGLYAPSSSAIEGQALRIGARRPAPTDSETFVAVQVFDSAFEGARPVTLILQFASGEATATGTMTVPFDGARPASRTLTATLTSVQRPYVLGSPKSLTFKVTDRDASVRVGDARVREGPQAALAFTVTLDRARDRDVTVEYATSDATARAGEDYTAVSGTLVFTAGERSGTVSVPVLDDAHDEGAETLTLRLFNARGAVIEDGEAEGTILNSDLMPDAWLSRFGRAASDQVVQSIGRRLEGGARESHVTVLGWRVDALFDSRRAGRVSGEEPEREAELESPRFGRDGAELRAGGTPGAPGGFMAQGAPGAGAFQMTEGATDALRAAPGAVHAPGARGRGGPWADMLQGLLMKVGAGGDVRAPGLSDMVMGSSFYYGHSPDAGPLRGMNRMAAWGESASTRFSGAEGKLSLDGEVNTAILGADGEWGRWLAGLALSYSEGEGGYRQASAKGGAVSSTLSGINPYARYRLDERTSFWGTLGYGSGRLTLTPDGAESSLQTDMTNAMAAFGGRGVLSMRGGETGQFELALRSDAMLTDTASMAVAGLSAGEGATSRIRLILEGAGSVPAFGGVLAPRVEAGLRYDGGDAETGAGLEVGGGLAYDKARLTVQVDGRVLLTHRDRDYEEWGYSLSFVYKPGEDGRGLRYQAGSQWGATQSGVQSLWSLQNAGGMANAARTTDGQRYTAELGYGFGVRRLWYPYVATESGGASSQALRFGLKLNAASDLEAGLEIGRRAHLSGQIENDIRLQWQARW